MPKHAGMCQQESLYRTNYLSSIAMHCCIITDSFLCWIQYLFSSDLKAKKEIVLENHILNDMCDRRLDIWRSANGGIRRVYWSLLSHSRELYWLCLETLETKRNKGWLTNQYWRELRGILGLLIVDTQGRCRLWFEIMNILKYWNTGHALDNQHTGHC